jgi:hypothetical protein
VIGLFTTELIKPGGPWRTVEQVEIATLAPASGPKRVPTHMGNTKVSNRGARSAAR